MELKTNNQYPSKYSLNILIKFYQSKKSLKELMVELDCSVGTASDIKNGVYRVRSSTQLFNTGELNEQIHQHLKLIDLLKKELEYIIRLRNKKQSIKDEQKTKELKEIIKTTNEARKQQLEQMRSD